MVPPNSCNSFFSSLLGNPSGFHDMKAPKGRSLGWGKHIYINIFIYIYTYMYILRMYVCIYIYTDIYIYILKAPLPLEVAPLSFCSSACAVTCAAGPGKLMSRWCFWGSEPGRPRLLYLPLASAEHMSPQVECPNHDGAKSLRDLEPQ